jgi:transposase
VKPYVKSNKNDANDAEAICEAVNRPNMRFVPAKSVEQQDIHRAHPERTPHEIACEFAASREFKAPKLLETHSRDDAEKGDRSKMRYSYTPLRGFRGAGQMQGFLEFCGTAPTAEIFHPPNIETILDP